MTIFSDIYNFIRTLTAMDIIFFLAVLILMQLVIVLIYFLKENKEVEIEILPGEKKDEDQELIDLQKITSALENAEPKEVDLNKYEEEQEEKAIISYDELLKHKNSFALNYIEEENIADDIKVKKVDMNNIVNKNVIEETKLNVQVISYEKEEAFLEALKTLQKLLN